MPPACGGAARELPGQARDEDSCLRPSPRCSGRRGALIACLGLAPLCLLARGAPGAPSAPLGLLLSALGLLLAPASASRPWASSSRPWASSPRPAPPRQLLGANGTAQASTSGLKGSCSRVTDGVCRLLPCKSWRGQTECIWSACVCKPGFCVNDFGVCVAAQGTCPKDTGSSCGYWGCSRSLGPTACVQGRCVCTGGTCANANGFCGRPNRTECRGNSGARCLGWIDWWCPANSECRHTRCQCKPGYCGSVSGQCLPKDTCAADTGGTCRWRSCDGFRGPTTCERGRCMCKLGFCAKDAGSGFGVCEVRKGQGTTLDQGPYVARVVPVNQLQPRFPPPHDNVTVAVAFSGGGWRAFSSAFGTLRALHHLGLMRDVDAISSVSGGSWAAAIYMFANTSADALLGPLRKPEDYTLEYADGEPPPFGRVATVGVRPWLRELSLLMRAQDLWPDFVARTFLDPFGIGSRAAFMAGSPEAVQRILRENPGLLHSQFLTPAAGRPPVFVMGGVVGAPAGYESEPGNIAYLQMSPDWIGSPFWPANGSVSYPPTAGNGLGPQPARVGGGLVESFAFGGRRPRSELGGEKVRLPPPFRPFSLAMAVAVSSCAPMSFLLDLPLGLDFALPSRRLWPIGGTWSAAEGRGLIHKLGDGGNMENVGLLPLLQRGARRAAVFVNSAEALTLHEYDFCQAGNARFSGRWLQGKVDTSLVSLFGSGVDGTFTGFLSHNQVFAADALAPTLCAMQKLKQAGKPIVHRTKLAVLPNSWWGVRGNFTLDLLITYLDVSFEFERKLPRETWRKLPKDFPHLPTVPLPDIRLSNFEVQLLSAQSEFAVVQNDGLFRDFLQTS